MLPMHEQWELYLQLLCAVISITVEDSNCTLSHMQIYCLSSFCILLVLYIANVCIKLLCNKSCMYLISCGMYAAD